MAAGPCPTANMARTFSRCVILEAVFRDPERLRGFRTREMLTKEAADAFSAISERLQHRSANREAVAHFINQLVFCFFAEDVKLLPEGLFKKQILRQARRHPERISAYLDGLFAAMEQQGGEYNHGLSLAFRVAGPDSRSRDRDHEHRRGTRGVQRRSRGTCDGVILN
jgi:hypothetical protein